MALGWLWWRAWAGFSRRWRRGTLRDRRGTWRHPPATCVAGAAFGDIHRRFAWQAWHLWRHAPSVTHNFVTRSLSQTIFTDTIFHTQLCHTLSFTHNFHAHTIFHTQLCHTHTHHLSLSRTIFHIQLYHTQLCYTSRSSTTSFVFLSFPVPATTFLAHCWKKLTCGVTGSFNFLVRFKRVAFTQVLVVKDRVEGSSALQFIIQPSGYTSGCFWLALKPCMPMHALCRRQRAAVRIQRAFLQYRQQAVQQALGVGDVTLGRVWLNVW